MVLWILGSSTVAADAAKSVEFKSRYCSAETYQPGDQRKHSISVVLTQLVSEAVDRITFNNKDYRADYPPQKPIVYGHAHCPWTFGIKSTCRSCLREAKKLLLHGCPHKVGASIELEYCSLRYENHAI
ncbi:unnamed protein product [Linum tenue]|uniref:Gnk2-homologous domain-containing protein n=1 Tax=Linum tenue TaxID=586396 RepID=A0AAV0S3F7_9ROSI|nr:unnamed protein product [Linum tenue]